MKKKKLFSFCAAAAMLLGTGATNAQTLWNIGSPTATDVVATLDDVTLTITGTGAMVDYTEEESRGTRLGSGKWIETLVINEGVTSIGDYAFSHRIDLRSVTIPNSVTSIGERAFSDCPNLRSGTIPNSVTSIGSGAFSGCPNLTVTIPNSMTSIGKGAFEGHAPSSGSIPNSVTSIGERAFYGSGLTSVTIPNSVTSIGGEAFAGSRLTSVTIPNSVTSIGDEAFFGTRILSSVTISNSVTSIGERAFAKCSGLISITVEAGNANYIAEDNVLFNKTKTTLILCAAKKDGQIFDFQYTIPNSVKSIEFGAFAECRRLTSVTIPDSVKSIGNEAFSGCRRLASVFCLAATPPSLGNDNFTEASADTLYVPKSALNTYKNNRNWSSAFDIILAIEAEES
ncbi:hypothetical protein AGMMS49965_01950 [Bacteroidia bacterium]|nr:hypothetical protein AGMMS49965_01950 [Bacteroidia bacterium]